MYMCLSKGHKFMQSCTFSDAGHMDLSTSSDRMHTLVNHRMFLGGRSAKVR